MVTKHSSTNGMKRGVKMISYKAKEGHKNLSNWMQKEEVISVDKAERKKQLDEKMKDDILTPEELKEYERLI